MFGTTKSDFAVSGTARQTLNDRLQLLYADSSATATDARALQEAANEPVQRIVRSGPDSEWNQPKIRRNNVRMGLTFC